MKPAAKEYKEETLPPISEERPAPLLPEDLEESARRYSFALDGTYEKEENIKGILESGGEDFVRQQAAAQMDFRKYEERRRLIQGLAGLTEQTEEEKAAIAGIMEQTANLTPTDKNTALEEMFGDQLINYGTAIGATRELNQELADPSGEGFDTLEVGSNISAIIERLRVLRAKYAAEDAKKGYDSTAYEIGVALVPFIGSYALNQAEGTEEWGIFEGSLRDRLVEEILWEPDREVALKKLDDFIEGIRSVSRWQANAFMDSLEGEGFLSRWVDNALTGVDFVGLAPARVVGTAARVGASASAGISKAAVRVATMKNPTAGKILANFGKTKAASVATATEAQKVLPRTNTFTQYDADVMAGVESILGGQRRYEGFFANSGAPMDHMVATEVANMEKTWNNLRDVYEAKVRPSRFTDEVQELNEAYTLNYWKKMGAQSWDNLVRVFGDEIPQPIGSKYEANVKIARVEKPEDTVQDVGYLTLSWGNPVTKNGFTSWDEGMRYAEQILGLRRDEVFGEQYGAHWFIQHRTPVVETGDGTLTARLAEGDHQLPESVANVLFSRVRSNDFLRSKHDRGTTKIAQHLPARVVEALEPVAEMVDKAAKKVGKAKWNQFLGFLDEHLNKEVMLKDPRDGKVLLDENGAPIVKTGYWSPDINSLEKDFFEFAKRPITPEESLAYLSYIQAMDFDYMVRGMKMLQEQSVKGIMQIEVPPVVVNGQLVGVGNHYAGSQPEIKGRFLSKIPEEDGREFNIAVFEEYENGMVYNNLLSNRSGDGKTGGNFDAEARDLIQKIIDEGGYKLIELAQPTQFPLANARNKNGVFKITDERVDYMLVPRAHQRNLRFIEKDTLKRSQGGHWDYTTKEYLVQDEIHVTEYGKAHLKGANPVIGVPRENTALMSTYYKELETVRKYMEAGNPAAAREFIATSKLPYDPDTLIARFLPRVDETTGVELPPIWNPNIPFRIQKGSGGIEDTDFAVLKKLYPNLRNEKDYKTNLYSDIDKKFIGERTAALETAIDAGDGGKYKLQPAPKKRALESLNSALHNAVRSVALDNTKKSMIDKWLSKYRGIIDASPEEIRSNPVWYFHNGTIRTTDKNLEVQAKIHKQSVLDMLGTHNETRTKYDFVKSKVLTWVEDRFGGNLADMVEGSALIQTRDPFKFARGVAFHLKIGLFNPVHYFLNAQSAAHGAFIVGDWKVVGKGLTGYHGSRMLMLNKHQEPFVRSVVKKMGYDADDFMYAHQSMLERGINRVEGDHILMDNHLEYNVFKTKTGEFLDKGTFFFKEGELIPRMEAWHMAWNEARKKKPTGKFTRTELEAIASRQDDLANNMTRKSASNLQQGWTSNATQFWSWQMRLMESMIGDRLTGPEKARLMIGYAAMYGLPGVTSAVGSIPTGVIGAVSSTVGVDPGLLGSTDHYSDIKKMALDRGIDVDTGVLSVLMDGLVAKGIEVALGKDTNWAQRMGPGGILLFELMSKNEAGIFDVLGGAGFQVLKDAFNKMAPLTNSAVRMIGGDQEFNATRTWEDFLHALSPISSVSNARLMMDIARVGEYRFRSGTLAMKDLDLGDAVLVGMGLSPQAIPDSFIESEILTDARGGKQKTDNAVKNYLAEHKRQVALAVKHYADGNLEAHKSYEESAAAIADIIRVNYPDQAFKLGYAFTNESMVEQIGRDFSVYRSKKEARQ